MRQLLQEVFCNIRRVRPWSIVLAVLLCAALAVGGVSYAAASETVIVLGSSSNEEKSCDLAVFGREYTDGAGRVLALSSDAANIIAPGLSGEHMVRIRNENTFTVEYEIVVDTSAKSAVRVSLPIEVRVTAGLESPKQWQRLGDTVSETISGTLDAGQEMSFYYQWRWNDSDDALDTYLAHEATEMTIRAQARISATQKTVRRSGSSSGSGSSGGSGVRWSASSRNTGPGAITDASAPGTAGSADSVNGINSAGSANAGASTGTGVNGGTGAGKSLSDITRPDVTGYSNTTVMYSVPQSSAVMSAGSWTQIPAGRNIQGGMPGGLGGSAVSGIAGSSDMGTSTANMPITGMEGGPGVSTANDIMNGAPVGAAGSTTAVWIFTAADGTRPAGGWIYTTSMYAQSQHAASTGMTEASGTAASAGASAGASALAAGAQGADGASGTADSISTGSQTCGWYYFTSDGRLAVGWIRMPDSGRWCYTTPDAGERLGMLHTGWLYEKRDGRWYYLAPESGIMCDGWRMIDDCWYCFTRREDADDHEWRMEQTAGGYMTWNYYGRRSHSYGSMYIREYTPDGYFVDAEGRWVQGA